MHTGIVQPSGPSIHCWMIFGSVWARYTAFGGAAKRRVTTTKLSPSVFKVILLIAVPFPFLVSYLPELCPAFRSFSPGRFAASPAIDRWFQSRAWRAGTDALCPRFDGR